MTIDGAQFARFVLVGALNTVIAYAAYAALLLAGLPYAAASLGALLLGIVTGFRMHGALVFRNHDQRLIWRFLVRWIVIYACNVAVIGLLVLLGIDSFRAGAVAIVPVALSSYLVQKIFVFGPRPAARVPNRKGESHVS